MKDIKLKDKIAQGINDLFYIWKREFQTTFRDQGVLIFFILVPLGYPLLYSFIYDNEVVREVPAVVVDDSHSSLSREYLRKVDATPDVKIVSYCADMEEAKQMLKNRRAYGIIYIPSDFSDNIAKGKQTQVSIYCDMSGLLYYKSMLIANTAVTISEFAGIASGLALFGVPASISVPLVALLVWMLTMSGSFQRIEKILLLVSCVFVTYIVAAFMAGPNWGEVAVDLVVPNIQDDPSYVSLVVATIGTTIAPWMIFLAQNNVVDKNAGEDDIVLQRIDTVSGSLAADVIAGFIIITTGTVLFPAGIQISDAADAARALEPIAGQWSTVLFASGLVAASFLAACVLPGVTSSAICEAFGWERGADRSWDEAPVYRGIITAIIGISAVLVLMPGVDLFQIMMTSQVINGVLLPVVLVFQVVIAADRHIMGANRNGRVWNVLTWATIAVITVLTVVMFVLQAMGYSA